MKGGITIITLDVSAESWYIITMTLYILAERGYIVGVTFDVPAVQVYSVYNGCNL